MIKKLLTALCVTGMISTAYAEEKAPAKPVAEVKPDGKAESFEEIFKEASFDVKLRLAYENSSVDNATDASNALTLSSYLGMRTAEYNGFSAYLQLHNNAALIDEYNDTQGGGDASYDVVADPEGSRVQQAYLDFKLIPDTLVRYGRQQVILDDARFIGNVGWRQNFQVFEGATVINKSIPDTELFLGYYDKIHNIFLNDVDFDHIILANAKYKGIEDHTFSAFAYFVDKETGTLDTATYGLTAKGKFGGLGYSAVGAVQTDYADGEDISGEYFHVHTGYKIGDWTPGIGYEYISGNDGTDIGFNTLFGTAHKFNGWADQFLGTGSGKFPDGLSDFYVDLKGKLMGNKVILAAHLFDRTEGNDDEYGYEIDALIARKLAKGLTGSIKAAYYDENASQSASKTQDETVVWLRLDYAFDTSK